MMYNLKPCPFCGGEAAVATTLDDEGGIVYSVGCHKCRIAIAKQREGYFWERKYDAIEAWNRRTNE